MAQGRAQGFGEVIGAVDLGSNSIKLTVARRAANGGGVEEFAWDSETVRLGLGLDASGRLADDRIAAAVATLARFADKARGLGAARVLGVATEAVRSATNGREFLDRVRAETGIAVEVIGGDREAELTFAGLDAGIDRAGVLVVADIGGASTEIVVAVEAVVDRSQSVPIGSGRYADRFVVADPPTAGELATCQTAARDAIAAAPALGVLPAGDGVRLVLVGGTGEYVGALAARAGGLNPAGIGRVLDYLTTIPAAALAAELGIEPARARVLPAGAAIAAAASGLTRPGAIVTARSGIRRGLLLEAFGTEHVTGDAPLGQ